MSTNPEESPFAPPPSLGTQMSRPDAQQSEFSHQRGETSVPDQTRFAGWLWRSSAETRATKPWIIWLLTLIMNVCLAGYLTTVLGFQVP